MKINIIDAICGAGKTSAAINYINNSIEDQHFLYITPYLTEVERIISACPNKKFKQPESYGTKLISLRPTLGAALTRGYKITASLCRKHSLRQE